MPAKAGEEYLVSGYAEPFKAAIDICVYEPAGDPVDCDTLPDYSPGVAFTAKTVGTYRAVMAAASVDGGGISFAGMIVLRGLDQGQAPEGSHWRRATSRGE